MVSMILGGVKLVTGYELRPNAVAHTEGSISFVKKYLRLGEWLFQIACNKAINSKSFIRVDWKEMSQSFSTNLLGSTKRMMDDFSKAFELSTSGKITEEL